MAHSATSIIGIVELAANDDVVDIQTSASFNSLREEFHSRLKSWVRPKDQWRSLNQNRVCVVLKDMDSAGELELAAAKLDRIFSEPHNYYGSQVRFNVTAGFAKFMSKEADLKLAMKHASIALNDAKHSDALFRLYSPQSYESCDSELQVLDKLDMALKAGEFELYYQPKVHAGYNTLMGAEALIRWHNSNGEMVPPDSFIEIAEKNEIIKPITWWVIKSAVARLSRWPESLSVAVNISPSMLLDTEIQSIVHDALDIYAVSADRLTLEVTERTVVKDREITLMHLHLLREMGVKISIDDFGTSYSSLSHFRDLPADEIKIDQCFVRTMLSSKKDKAIVKAIIDLAHNFSLRVVAEGVENAKTADELKTMGCDILQGYFYDKPLPASQFEMHYKL